MKISWGLWGDKKMELKFTLSNPYSFTVENSMLSIAEWACLSLFCKWIYGVTKVNFFERELLSKLDFKMSFLLWSSFCLDYNCLINSSGVRTIWPSIRGQIFVLSELWFTPTEKSKLIPIRLASTFNIPRFLC